MSQENYSYSETIENLAIGKIIEVDGSHIIAELSPNLSELSRIYAGDIYSIGQFGSVIKIHFGHRLIYALVGRLRMKSDFQAERGIESTSSPDERIIEANLFGEGEWGHNDCGELELKFERGISTYPLPQQTVYLTPKSELKYIYGNSKGSVIQIGHHVESMGAPCFADLNELLGKHTAVLGSTGTGKSGTVAAIIHSILGRGDDKSYDEWNPRIVILDPHDEYSNAFDDHTKLSSDDGSLILPYWLLNFQETVSLLVGKTEHAATSQANIVKEALIVARKKGAELIKIDADLITVDSPVPYELDHFRCLIQDSEISKGSSKTSRESITGKLDVLRNDTRFDFMMAEWDESCQDTLPDIINKLIGPDAQPCIINLSGIPNEVASISSAVIARTLFYLKIWQTQPEREADPVLLVCEEAHRYVPNQGEAQYDSAQEAIMRIAKEGRKYGMGLLLVSQRPSEVEATVLSQCNSWIVLRITNSADKNYVQSILPDSMSGLTNMLSDLRRQEAIFVGQAATLPSRIIIRELDPDKLPQSNDIDFDRGWKGSSDSAASIEAVIARWRYQQKI